MSDIDEVFKLLQQDADEFIEYTSKTFLHKSTQEIAAVWAYEIIDILISKNVKPGLMDSTIKRRKSRGKNVLGNDYPLLETGEWITYIEFQIYQHEDYDELKVGVFDETTQIGHTGDVTPSYIAEISEYGDDLYIIDRAPFAESELRILPKIDAIIKSAWETVISRAYTVTNLHVDSIQNLIGRIVYDGSTFIFRWD